MPEDRKNNTKGTWTIINKQTKANYPDFFREKIWLLQIGMKWLTDNDNR